MVDWVLGVGFNQQGGRMDEQTYQDTLQSLCDANQSLIEENEELKQTVERHHQANEIRKEKGLQKQSQKGAYFTKVFIAATKKLTPILQPNEKSFLFDVLPYLDYDTNFIVDAQQQRLNLKGIADLHGMSERQVVRILNSLEEKLVIQRKTVGQNTYVYLNPQYFYRKTGTPPSSSRILPHSSIKRCMRMPRLKMSCLPVTHVSSQNRVKPSRIEGYPLFFIYISSLS